MPRVKWGISNGKLVDNGWINRKWFSFPPFDNNAWFTNVSGYLRTTIFNLGNILKYIRYPRKVIRNNVFICIRKTDCFALHRTRFICDYSRRIEFLYSSCQNPVNTPIRLQGSFSFFFFFNSFPIFFLF